jgi:hypothetical protein
MPFMKGTYNLQLICVQDDQLSKPKDKQEEYIEALKKGGVVSDKWLKVVT